MHITEEDEGFGRKGFIIGITIGTVLFLLSLGGETNPSGMINFSGLVGFIGVAIFLISFASRLKRFEWPPFLAFLGLVPGINILFILILSLCDGKNDEQKLNLFGTLLSSIKVKRIYSNNNTTKKDDLTVHRTRSYDGPTIQKIRKDE